MILNGGHARTRTADLLRVKCVFPVIHGVIVCRRVAGTSNEFNDFRPSVATGDTQDTAVSLT